MPATSARSVRRFAHARVYLESGLLRIDGDRRRVIHHRRAVRVQEETEAANRVARNRARIFALKANGERLPGQPAPLDLGAVVNAVARLGR